MDTKQVRKIDNLSEAQIYAIQTDANHIYLGTLEGLWVVNKKSMAIQKFTVDNGLSNNYITACFPLNPHQVLIGTFKGINLIDLRDNLVSVYQISDGISDDECNFIAHHQDNNNILIGTINGLTLLNKKQLSIVHQLKPSIYKTQNSSFDSVSIHYITQGNKLIFDPGVQKMVIHLESPSQHTKIRYAYRFYDLDTTWIRDARQARRRSLSQTQSRPYAAGSSVDERPCGATVGTAPGFLLSGSGIPAASFARIAACN